MAIIVIDPGHTGGYNPGVCANYYEGNAMLALAFYLGEALEARGADVRYTRTSDFQNPSLEERGRTAANADLFISLHSDATDNPAIRGVTSYYSVRQPWTQSFAANIGMAAAGAMGNQFRGAMTRTYTNNPSLDYYGVIRSAVAAGAQNAFIIEHGFHTNMEDCLILSDQAALRRIAQAEARVIADYFGLPEMCVSFQYTVQQGDSLFEIGRRFGIPWQRIAVTNNLVYPYTIFPDQILTIPLCS